MTLFRLLRMACVTLSVVRWSDIERGRLYLVRWCPFLLIWRWMICWPCNLGYRLVNIIHTVTIQNFACGLFITICSKYGSILHHLSH